MATTPAPCPAPLLRVGDSADEAIPKLVAAHGGTIYRIGLRLCGNAEDAEELAQEVFLNAWRGWEGFEGRAKPTTWLYTIAARVCQRRKRRRAGEPDHIDSWESLSPAGEGALEEGDRIGPSAAGLDPQVAFARSEAQRIVDRAIGEVAEPYKLPLVLKDIAGLSLNEIGAALGVKPATIKTRVHRGRNALRAALEQAAAGRGDAATHDGEDGICHALLEARQEALDRGAPFPVPDALIDDRCRRMLERLELAHDLCRRIAEEGLPEPVEGRLLAACRDSADRATTEAD